MPWKTMDVREQRVRFAVAAVRKEKCLTALCQEFGISRPTGYLWQRRYQQDGIAGIADEPETVLRGGVAEGVVPAIAVRVVEQVHFAAQEQRLAVDQPVLLARLFR